MIDALTKHRRIRASVKGHFGKLVHKFETTRDTLDSAHLQVMLDQVEEYNKRFVREEEIIIGLTELEENGDPDEEIVSDMAERFFEEYMQLKRNILELLESKKPKPEAADNTTDSRSQPVRLPKLELPKFSGKYTEWTDFHNEFTSLVSNPSLTDIDRFRFLRSALGEAPRRIISSMEVTAENYKKAYKALRERYDNRSLIFRAHVNEILSLQPMSGTSAERCRELIDKAQSHYRAMESLADPEEISENLMISLLLMKIDTRIQMKWEEETDNSIPSWEGFVEFLEKHASTLEKIDQTKQQLSRSSINIQRHPGQKKHTTLVVNSNTNCCYKCSSSAHNLKDCPEFLKMPVQDRVNEAKRLKICMKCLTSNHSFSKCKVTCKTCKKSHNSLLHMVPPATSQPDPTANPTPFSQTLIAMKNLDDDHALLASVIVLADDVHGNKVSIHALLDSGSTRHYVSERLVRLLQAKKFKCNTHIGGIGGTTTSSKDCCSFKFKSIINSREFEIQASILPLITGTYPPTSFEVTNWGIPSNLALADPDFNRSKKIDLLIGAGLFWTLLKPGRLMLGPNLPMLQDTELGWIVVGSTTMPTPSRHSTFYAVRQTPAEIESESLDDLVQKFWEVDSVPEPKKLLISEEDKRCEEHFVSTFRRTDSGRYVVRLPFRTHPSQLGNSFEIARRRFINLERRLDQNPELKTMYGDFIKEYEELNHLEVLENFDFTVPHYFIPHHCVLKLSSSTTKLRVVFDASCKTSNGISLNDILYSGPKLQDDIFTLMLRFRLTRFVVTTDIQKMYRQFQVDERDANFQLILWRTNKSEQLKVLRLRTVTYGTAPGAFLSVRSLHQLAEDECSNFPIGAEVLLKDLYVDDALIGSDTETELEEKVTQLQSILKCGGLRLGKYCSNSARILNKIDPNLQEKFVEFNDHKVIKALGLMWDPENDVFRYKYEVNHTTEDSKRSILSQVARIFDPLGFLCPVVTLAKIFYQELWSTKLGWDDKLPQELFLKWSTFRSQLIDLKQIAVHRYLFAHDDVLRVQLHGFADASQRAYGACVYLRCTLKDNSHVVKLCCAKSRVAPKKTLTIARLELCAAKLLTDLVHRLNTEVLCGLQISGTFYWSDSSIVLSWLKAEPQKWNTFVAHRVARIQELSNSEQWFHVPGIHNPADLISRGVIPSELVGSSLWWNGPEYLFKSQDHWPRQISNSLPDDQIEEARIVKPVLTAFPVYTDITSNMHFSTNFRGTRRAFAYVTRFIINCIAPVLSKTERREKLNLLQKHGFKGIENDVKTPTLKDEIESEELFLRSIQKTEFKDDYKILKTGQPLSKTSHIIALSPFIDGSGLIRVGGRLKRSSLHYDSKHQILLPQRHPLTQSIIRYFHSDRVCHMGPQVTLTAVRSRYWPVGGVRLCRSVTQNCNWCFRLKPRLYNQYMGELPRDRVEIRRPFEVTGVDFAGPFSVRHHIRCKQGKQVHLALFICFTTKAVYIDLVPDLSTEAFLRALRRFVADRGPVSKIYSDNATNFKGACNYLMQIKEMLKNSSKNIEETCSHMHIQWSFIPPRAPHKGGLWEASVKLLKRIIRNVVGELNLTEDEFRTVSKQASSVINSRPITTLSSDPNDLEPLTPGHFLFGAPPSAVPEPLIEPRVLNTPQSVDVLHRMQYASQQLWDRFRKEYLALLQPRSKWFFQTSKVVPGTVVLLKEDNVDSLKWPMGRVIAVMPDKDGRVRRLRIKTSTGELERDISRCAVLPNDDEVEVLSIRSTARSVLKN